MGALGLSTPQAVKQNRWRFLLYVLAYNMGRIFSYASVGAVLWLIESVVPESFHLSRGHLILRLIGAAVMLGAGLHLAGWFPDFKRLEVVGRPLWRKLEPVARRLLPVKSLPMALAYGAVWGWLPCGLVYMALFYALSQSATANPALMMAAFGVGTLPIMLALGLVFQPMLNLARNLHFRRVAGILICIMALVSVVFVPQHHHQHMPLELESTGDPVDMPHHHHH